MTRNSFSQTVPPRRLWTFCTFILLTAWLLSSAGCANVGREFPTNKVPSIQIGKTTQAEIRTMFGSPWRIGAKDGQMTWTYGKYQYRLFGEASTQDLVIYFNNKNIVTSYTYNTTEHNE